MHCPVVLNNNKNDDHIYLDEGVWRSLPLTAYDDGNVHDHKLIARVEAIRPPVGEEC